MGKTLDFSNVQSNDVLDEGTYEFKIDKVEEKVSKSGKDMLLVTFREVEKGSVVWENYLYQENCLWKLKELLDAVGFDTSSVVDFDPQDLVGQMVTGKVIQEEYNGNMKNRMAKVFPC